VSFGVISYGLVKVASGRGKDVDWLLYLVAGLLIVRYIWLGGV
jgi:adenine/guanine/hypoxanthine permease